MFDYIADLLAEAALGAPSAAGGWPEEGDDRAEVEYELRKLKLLSRARVVLDIIEAQSVHTLRHRVPQISYGDIGHAQGISKQASRIRHTKLEQVLKVHQLDGRRHAMVKAVVSARHRRAAKPGRQARRRIEN